jgi:hypothetical protein
MGWYLGRNVPVFLVHRCCATMPPHYSTDHAVCWGESTMTFAGITISEVAI